MPSGRGVAPERVARECERGGRSRAAHARHVRRAQGPSHRLRQFVAHSSNVHDPRSRRRAQLLPQPARVRVERARAALALVAPHVAEQLVLAVDARRAPRPARAAARTPSPPARPSCRRAAPPGCSGRRSAPPPGAAPAAADPPRAAIPRGCARAAPRRGTACRRGRRRRARSCARDRPHASCPLSTITGRSGSIREARPSACRTRSSRSSPLPPSRARSSTTRLGLSHLDRSNPLPRAGRADRAKAVRDADCRPETRRVASSSSTTRITVARPCTA